MTRQRFVVLAFPIAVLAAASCFIGLLVSATPIGQSEATADHLRGLQNVILTAQQQGALYGPSSIEDTPHGMGRWLYLDEVFEGASLAFTITNLGDTSINIMRGAVIYDTVPPRRSISFTSPVNSIDDWGYEGTGHGTVLRFAYVVRQHSLD